MSLINDALKEARQDRADGDGNSSPNMGFSRPPKSSGNGKGVVIALVVMGSVFTLLLGGVVLVVFALFAKMQVSEGPVVVAAADVPPPEVQTLSPTVDPLPPETAPPVPSDPAPVVTPGGASANTQTQANPGQTATGTPAGPSLSPEQAAPPVESPPAVTSASGPGAADPEPKAEPEILPATARIRTQYDLKGIMKGRRGNMALINSRILRKDAVMKEGAMIEDITETEVILNIDGTRYRLIYTP